MSEPRTKIHIPVTGDALKYLTLVRHGANHASLQAGPEGPAAEHDCLIHLNTVDLHALGEAAHELAFGIEREGGS